MNKPFLFALLAWLIPGAAHFALKRRLIGGLLFAGTVSLITAGAVLGGVYYPGNPADFGIMYWLHQISGAGNAIFVVLNFFFKADLSAAVAQKAFSSATFEYAGRCLALAGLLNYLAILDVFDILLRRK